VVLRDLTPASLKLNDKRAFKKYVLSDFKGKSKFFIFMYKFSALNYIEYPLGTGSISFVICACCGGKTTLLFIGVVAAIYFIRIAVGGIKRSNTCLTYLKEHADDPQAVSALIDSLKTELQAASVILSPLTLDLDGDGMVETTSKENSGVYFDHDNNSFAEQSGWVGKDDGLSVPAVVVKLPCCLWALLLLSTSLELL
jgi:hypothetical protein